MSVNQDMFAKITMAIWFQVSGVRCQVTGLRRHAALRERFIIYALYCRFLS